MNGVLATRAERTPSAVAADKDVPTAECSIGTQASPTFFFSLGDQTDEVIFPTASPDTSTGKKYGFMSSGSPSISTPTNFSETPCSEIRRNASRLADST